MCDNSRRCSARSGRQPGGRHQFERGAFPAARRRTRPPGSCLALAPASDPRRHRAHSHVSNAASRYVQPIDRVNQHSCTTSSEASRCLSKPRQGEAYAAEIPVKNSSNAASSPAITRRTRATSLGPKGLERCSWEFVRLSLTPQARCRSEGDRLAHGQATTLHRDDRASCLRSSITRHRAPRQQSRRRASPCFPAIRILPVVRSIDVLAVVRPTRHQPPRQRRACKNAPPARGRCSSRSDLEIDPPRLAAAISRPAFSISALIGPVLMDPAEGPAGPADALAGIASANAAATTFFQTLLIGLSIGTSPVFRGRLRNSWCAVMPPVRGGTRDESFGRRTSGCQAL